MNIIIADFELAKYGGIIEHVTAKIKALKKLGHKVDIIKFTDSSISFSSYDKKVKTFEDGSFEDTRTSNSERRGFELDETTGYWKNNYHGFFLPPENRINVFEENAIEKWLEVTKNVDLIFWNFMPTKSKIWKREDFSFWWKFFDLPTDKIKQVFTVHDAYFDIRTPNITALKKKILFLECAHIAAYRCCENIGIHRALFLNPRYLKKNAQMPIIEFKKRKIDFFAAHVFKSMKHVDDLIKSIPYFNTDKIRYKTFIAGSGIEQAYMVAEYKCKDIYKVNKKNDPDAEEEVLGMPIWERAENHGMNYIGQISGQQVIKNLLNTKFAIDPSYSDHYAKFCRTHINGFIIEAMLCGAYPVLRDYSGLNKKNEKVFDPIFDNIKAIIIPWNATPKEFALALKKASKMSEEKFLEDTQHNFNLVYELFNATKNMKEVLRLVNGGKSLVKKELEKGVDSNTVKQISNEIMTNFFGISLPIQWKTD